MVQSSLYLQFKSKTRLKSCSLVLNFVSDLAQVGGSTMHTPSSNILADNHLIDLP